MPAGIEIAVACSVRTEKRAAPLAARAARHAAAAEGFRTGTLSIAIVGARRMATLHERYMGIRGATDVLTFDLGTDRRRGHIEGEIVVCADVARRAARTTHSRFPGQRIRAELTLYVVHGLLHLAGYDDHTPGGFRRMHAREDELLQQLGLGPVFSARSNESSEKRRQF